MDPVLQDAEAAARAEEARRAEQASGADATAGVLDAATLAMDVAGVVGDFAASVASGACDGVVTVAGAIGDAFGALG